jgi:hypothetical protein
MTATDVKMIAEAVVVIVVCIPAIAFMAYEEWRISRREDDHVDR